MEIVELTLQDCLAILKDKMELSLYRYKSPKFWHELVDLAEEGLYLASEYEEKGKEI